MWLWPLGKSRTINERVSDMGHIAEMFPLPSTVVSTSGNMKGIIIRFKTFYFKVYQANFENTFNFQGFRYNEHNPVVDENVRRADLRAFAAMFNEHDYLEKFTDPCEDPFCFLRKI